MSVVTLAADQRISRGVASSLRWTNVDEYGEPVASSPAPTVTVTRADGTTVVTGAATTLEAGTTGTYKVTLTAAQVGDLDVLTAVWSISAVAVATTTAEVVGRWSFTVAQLRDSHPMFQQQGQTWTAPVLAYYRTLAEQEAELICGRAFVPRYRRVTLDGNGDTELHLPDVDLRQVVAASDNGTAFTVDQLAAVKVYTSGRLKRESGDIWPSGQENLVLSYHHGLDAPPLEVRHAEMHRARELASAGGPVGTAINARATSMTTDGTTLQLDMAGRYKTGNPDVDAVYDRWSVNAGAGGDGSESGSGLAPYSRQIDWNPQYDSLFHGGRR